MATESERRENVEQVEAMQRLEGFDTTDTPKWFKELTDDYIKGKVTAEEASLIGHKRLQAGDF